MIEFEVTIERFKEKGEKSGWTYIPVDEAFASELSPGSRKSFRVKGKVDAVPFEFIALIPMGDGSFIMPLNAEIRKRVKKGEGDFLKVQMEPDLQDKPLCPDLILCLEDAANAKEYFKSLPKGHQRYFSNWIESAKTDGTKAKRIAQAIVALGMGLGYGEMMRMNKKSVS